MAEANNSTTAPVGMARAVGLLGLPLVVVIQERTRANRNFFVNPYKILFY